MLSRKFDERKPLADALLMPRNTYTTPRKKSVKKERKPTEYYVEPERYEAEVEQGVAPPEPEPVVVTTSRSGRKIKLRPSSDPLGEMPKKANSSRKSEDGGERT